MKKIFILFIFFCACIGCGSYVRTTYTEDIQDVSMIQLIANPAQFHHKKVRVIGFAVIEFECSAIFLSKEFADYYQSKDALWLANADLKYDRKYVLVEGMFDKNDHGHLNHFHGAITNVSRIQEWRKIENSTLP